MFELWPVKCRYGKKPLRSLFTQFRILDMQKWNALRVAVCVLPYTRLYLYTIANSHWETDSESANLATKIPDVDEDVVVLLVGFVYTMYKIFLYTIVQKYTG